MKKGTAIAGLFVAMIIDLTLLILGGNVFDFLHGKLFLGVAVLYGVLGAVLLVLVIKEKKIKNWLRKFLILTGGSAAGFFVFMFLHNMLYAVAIVTEHLPILHYTAEALHVAFFFASVICPLGFLVGVIGTIVVFIKKKYK